MMFGFQAVVPQLPGMSAASVAPPRQLAQPLPSAPRQSRAKAPAAAEGRSNCPASRGRKKRDIIKEAVRVSSEFAVATVDDVSFFGTGSKVMIQWMLRLQKDFAERQGDREWLAASGKFP